MKYLLLFGVLFLFSACVDTEKDTSRKIVKPVSHQGKFYDVTETTTKEWERVSYLPIFGGGTVNTDSEPVISITTYTVSIDGRNYPCASAGDCQNVVAKETAKNRITPAANVPTEGEGPGGH